MSQAAILDLSIHMRGPRPPSQTFTIGPTMEAAKLWWNNSLGGQLNFSMLSYYMLKYPLKYEPSGTVYAHFDEYLNDQWW